MRDRYGCLTSVSFFFSQALNNGKRVEACVDADRSGDGEEKYKKKREGICCFIDCCLLGRALFLSCVFPCCLTVLASLCCTWDVDR